MDELTILVAVTDSEQNLVSQIGPDGEHYPVLRLAPPSPLLDRIYAAAHTTFVSQAMRLHRYAQQLVLSQRVAGGSTDIPSNRAVPAPIYLFLSDEEGGFARCGFWFQDERRERTFVPAGYINMVVSDVVLERGIFENTFVHELGHLTLRTLIGKVPPGPSRTMHQSMSVTDYPTALDEGWAEHFEVLVVDHSENPWLLGHQRGTFADLIDTWVSEVDGHLRQVGVRRNLFVHDKPLPESALAAYPDPFKVWLEGETMGSFLLDRLKTGQAMLSCEGVAATLFYRFVTTPAIRNNWAEPGFYAQFLPPGTPVQDPRDHFSPYENANLKLFAAMRQLAQPLDPHRILLLDLVRAYATCFPREVSPLYQILLDTTWGATVSQEVAVALEELANQGQTGNQMVFREGINEAVKILRSLHADLLAGQIALDANVGPELWVLNKSFLIPQSAIRTDLRVIPFALNLNTASVPELMTIEGIDRDLARAIVARRRELGFYTSIDDLYDVVGMTRSLVESLRDMQQEMAQANLYERA